MKLKAPCSFTDLFNGNITLKDGTTVPFWARFARSAPKAIRDALNLSDTSHQTFKKHGVLKATLNGHPVLDFTENKPARPSFDRRPVTKQRGRNLSFMPLAA